MFVGGFDRAELVYEYYPETYAGMSGSMVPLCVCVCVWCTHCVCGASV